MQWWLLCPPTNPSPSLSPSDSWNYQAGGAAGHPDHDDEHIGGDHDYDHNGGHPAAGHPYDVIHDEHNGDDHYYGHNCSDQLFLKFSSCLKPSKSINPFCKY